MRTLLRPVDMAFILVALGALILVGNGSTP
jgi:hypothetical protein